MHRTGFVSVQFGFLQHFLRQTWVKCISLDSSRCADYFGDVDLRHFGQQEKIYSWLNAEKSDLTMFTFPFSYN